MEKVLNFGFIITTITDAITLKLFNKPDGDKNYEANKKKFQRMKNLNIDDLKNNPYQFSEFVEKVNSWSKWAKKNDYLKEWQQTAMSDFFTEMREVAVHDMPLEKNMTEHFLCFALAKVLYNQCEEFKKIHPSADKFELIYRVLSNYDFFGDDETYNTDFTPVGSCFALFKKYVKDINNVIEYWEGKIDSLGKKDVPPNLKSYFNKWSKGTVPSWEILKLFFDKELELPKEYFIDDFDVQKDGYRAFKANLFISFILTNLFDSLKKRKIITDETRKMIRNGSRLYYRDFFVRRNLKSEEFSNEFEPEAKNNLMFKVLWLVLENDLCKEFTTMDFMNEIYKNPSFLVF